MEHGTEHPNNLTIMIHSDVVRIAAKNGWKIVVAISPDGFLYYDFHCRMRSGVPFCLTVDFTKERVTTLVDEIIGFVDAFDPERYAAEWLVKTGITSQVRYIQAVADMDEVRIRAWLLAIDLSEIAEKVDRLLDFTWYNWN